ncbi:CND2 protein, partial [Bombycilla garrulus]|nr:CND2 protein [Bombycilla garrulus]
GDIGALSQQVSLNPGEYSYFSPRTLSMWAGPEHWRFLPRKQPAAPAQDSRRRIPRKAFELDFDEDIDFQSHFRKTKASTTLSKPVVEARSSRSTTLPEDFSYDPKNLSQLFLKPHIRVSQRVAPVETLESEAGIEDYDYNNPNDTSNFCPGLQVSDSEDDPDPVGFLGTAPLPPLPEAPEPPGITARNNDPVPGELELIAEPHKVHKASIQYARKATRVDMRLLKWNMWDLLTARAGIPCGKGCWSLPGAVIPIPALIPIPFFLRLPPAMAADLSVPLALMCLLHLANEKNLRLENTEDLSDIRV